MHNRDFDRQMSESIQMERINEPEFEYVHPRASTVIDGYDESDDEQLLSNSEESGSEIYESACEYGDGPHCQPHLLPWHHHHHHHYLEASVWTHKQSTNKQLKHIICFIFKNKKKHQNEENKAN